ncbi:hypothetical protein [Streptomyces sp. YKOK-I1]
MSATENAVALRFTDRAAADRAFDDLMRLAPARTEVRGAVLIERLEDGTVHVPAVLETAPGPDATADGLVGSLMGLLGGPLGVAMGWGISAAIAGGRHDRRAEGALGVFAPHFPRGGVAILAEAAEHDQEALNLLAMTYDAVLERRPADTVRIELNAMQKEAELIRERQREAAGVPLRKLAA